MVMGLVSRLFLASHSDSGAFLVARASQPRQIPAKRILGGSKNIWADILSPFDLSQFLPVGSVAGQNLGFLCPLKLDKKVEFGGNRKVVLILSWRRGEQSRLHTAPAPPLHEKSRCLYKMRGCCSEKGKRGMSFSFPFLETKKTKRTVTRPEHS